MGATWRCMRRGTGWIRLLATRYSLLAAGSWRRQRRTTGSQRLQPVAIRREAWSVRREAAARYSLLAAGVEFSRAPVCFPGRGLRAPVLLASPPCAGGSFSSRNPASVATLAPSGARRKTTSPLGSFRTWVKWIETGTFPETERHAADPALQPLRGRALRRRSARRSRSTSARTGSSTSTPTAASGAPPACRRAPTTRSTSIRARGHGGQVPLLRAPAGGRARAGVRLGLPRAGDQGRRPRRPPTRAPEARPTATRRCGSRSAAPVPQTFYTGAHARHPRPARRGRHADPLPRRGAQSDARARASRRRATVYDVPKPRPVGRPHRRLHGDQGARVRRAHRRRTLPRSAAFGWASIVFTALTVLLLIGDLHQPSPLPLPAHHAEHRIPGW